MCSAGQRVVAKSAAALRALRPHVFGGGAIRALAGSVLKVEITHLTINWETCLTGAVLHPASLGSIVQALCLCLNTECGT